MARAEIAAQSGGWKTLLISPNKTILGEISPLLSQYLPNAAVFEMQSYPARQVLQELGGAQGPNLCFLDLISDMDRALPLIGDLMLVQPSIKIIVLLGSKHPDAILRAIRQGAAEFLVRPFDPDQFEHALDRIAALRRQDGTPATQGRVLAVIPAKGACGASTVAAHLAQHFKRAGTNSILLADLDPLTGTLSFLFKLKPTYSFLDVLSRSSSLDADVWKGIVTQRSGIDILLAPETVDEAVHELRDSAGLVEYARSCYDAVVIDTGSAFGGWNLDIARNSDEVLLVTTNELPALQAAQRSITYLEANGVPGARIKLIVNRYNREYGLSREVIETALHCEVFHVVPSEYEAIQAALLEGKSVPPSTGFGKSIAQLGDRLIPRPKGAEPAKKTSALSGLLSIFSRTR
jgi:pilus assembly protein CpaE